MANAPKSLETIVILEPISESVEKLLSAIQGGKVANIVRTRSMAETIDQISANETALFLVSVCKKESVTNSVPLLKKFQAQIRSGTVKPVIVSAIQNAQLDAVFQKLGVLEIIQEPVQIRSLVFKLQLHLKALAKSRALKEKDDAFEVAQNAKKDQFEGNSFRFGAKKKQKEKEKFVVEVDAPDPKHGDWEKIDSEDAKTKWRFVPKTEEGKKQAKNVPNVESAEKPKYDPKKKKWNVETESPKSVFSKPNQSDIANSTENTTNNFNSRLDAKEASNTSAGEINHKLNSSHQGTTESAGIANKALKGTADKSKFHSLKNAEEGQSEGARAGGRNDSVKEGIRENKFQNKLGDAASGENSLEKSSRERSGINRNAKGGNDNNGAKQSGVEKKESANNEEAKNNEEKERENEKHAFSLQEQLDKRNGNAPSAVPSIGIKTKNTEAPSGKENETDSMPLLSKDVEAGKGNGIKSKDTLAKEAAYNVNKEAEDLAKKGIFNNSKLQNARQSSAEDKNEEPTENNAQEVAAPKQKFGANQTVGKNDSDEHKKDRAIADLEEKEAIKKRSLLGKNKHEETASKEDVLAQKQENSVSGQTRKNEQDDASKQTAKLAKKLKEDSGNNSSQKDTSENKKDKRGKEGNEDAGDIDDFIDRDEDPENTWSKRNLEASDREVRRGYHDADLDDEEIKWAAINKRNEEIAKEIADKADATRKYYRGIAELELENAAWQKLEGSFVYVSAESVFRGIPAVDSLMPLWVFKGDNYPLFLEQAKKWQFLDRNAQKVKHFDDLSFEVQDFLRSLVELAQEKAKSTSSSAEDSLENAEPASKKMIREDAYADLHRSQEDKLEKKSEQTGRREEENKNKVENNDEDSELSLAKEKDRKKESQQGDVDSENALASNKKRNSLEEEQDDENGLPDHANQKNRDKLDSLAKKLEDSSRDLNKNAEDSFDENSEQTKKARREIDEERTENLAAEDRKKLDLADQMQDAIKDKKQIEAEGAATAKELGASKSASEKDKIEQRGGLAKEKRDRDSKETDKASGSTLADAKAEVEQQAGAANEKKTSERSKIDEQKEIGKAQEAKAKAEIDSIGKNKSAEKEEIKEKSLDSAIGGTKKPRPESSVSSEIEKEHQRSKDAVNDTKLDAVKEARKQKRNLSDLNDSLTSEAEKLAATQKDERNDSSQDSGSLAEKREAAIDKESEQAAKGKFTAEQAANTEEGDEPNAQKQEFGDNVDLAKKNRLSEGVEAVDTKGEGKADASLADNSVAEAELNRTIPSNKTKKGQVSKPERLESENANTASAFSSLEEALKSKAGQNKQKPESLTEKIREQTAAASKQGKQVEAGAKDTVVVKGRALPTEDSNIVIKGVTPEDPKKEKRKIERLFGKNIKGKSGIPTDMQELERKLAEKAKNAFARSRIMQNAEKQAEVIKFKPENFRTGRRPEQVKFRSISLVLALNHCLELAKRGSDIHEELNNLLYLLAEDIHADDSFILSQAESTMGKVLLSAYASDRRGFSAEELLEDHVLAFELNRKMLLIVCKEDSLTERQEATIKEFLHYMKIFQKYWPKANRKIA